MVGVDVGVDVPDGVLVRLGVAVGVAVGSGSNCRLTVILSFTTINWLFTPFRTNCGFAIAFTIIFVPFKYCVPLQFGPGMSVTVPPLAGLAWLVTE